MPQDLYFIVPLWLGKICSSGFCLADKSTNVGCPLDFSC